MSQSFGNGGRSDAPTKDEERPEPTTFTLSVISPSSEVASPLSFPHLLASTTVQELKAKIRDVVPSNPDNNSQRLIHRGRMLGDAQTMLQIFGDESLSNPDVQVLHLVLRPPLSDSAPASTDPANPVPSPHQRIRLEPSTTTQDGSRIVPPPSAIQTAQEAQSQQQLQQRLHHFQDLHHAEHSHNVMTQRLHQLQRETERLQQEIEAGARGFNQLGRLMNNAVNQAPTAPSVTRNPFQPPDGQGRTSLQQLILEQQQRRAAEGRQGAQDIGRLPPLPNSVHSGRPAPSFRNPERSTTYTREGVGPNGERWQVTVNETTTTIPVQQLQQRHNNNGGNGVQITANPAVDLQHMLRNADRFMAPHHRQDGERRSSSNPPPARAGIHSPPTSTAGRASASASHSLPMAVLNPTINASAPNLGATPAGVSSSSSTPSAEPMVYILTSPSGPRALLINNSETFYTPRHPRYRYAGNPPPPIHGQAPIGLPEYRNRIYQRAIRREGRLRANEGAAVNLAQAHNQNPRPGVPVVLRLFNLLWLVVRLAGFVWFFTSGNSSWSRLFLMSSLALVVFFINTGIFTGLFNTIAEHLLGPIRRYLENLIPLAGPDAALVPAANVEVVRPAPAPETEHQPQPRRRRGELDETQVAARLVEEQRRRRAHGGWFVAQIRRAEHAALLFVASLIPGIGERHIAARDNAARQAEAAAERERVEAENAANAANVENSGDAQTNNESTETVANQGENVDAQQAPPAEPVAAF